MNDTYTVHNQGISTSFIDTLYDNPESCMNLFPSPCLQLKSLKADAADSGAHRSGVGHGTQHVGGSAAGGDAYQIGRAHV